MGRKNEKKDGKIKTAGVKRQEMFKAGENVTTGDSVHNKGLIDKFEHGITAAMFVDIDVF